MASNSASAPFTTQVCKFDSDLWYYYVPVPVEVAEPFVDGENRRVICTLEGKVSFHCALMPDGAGAYFINVNQKRRKELGLVLGQTVTASLEKDDSKYGMPMSEEFREVLSQEDEARGHFEVLTPGKQRTLIYWVDNVKSSQIKIRRALVMAEHLTSRSGQVDFRALNEEMKAANKRAKLQG